MVEFARGLAADENGLTFKFVHGGNGFLCDTQQLHDFRTRIRAARDQGWEPMTNVCYLERFMSSYTKEEDIADGVPLRSFYQEHETRCFTPYLFALIDAFGDVYPCCFLYHDNDSYSPFKDKRATYRMGRLSEEHFDAIWQGAKFTQIRRDLETIDASRLPECKQCTRHYLHNAVLTELLGKYEYYAREFSGGTDVFKQVLEQYPPEVVWL
jgi:MoaA/NifB/PqqE/SkfB family radical SAM enzyme